MSKPSGEQTVTQKPDEQTQQYRDEVWRRAQQVSQQPYQGYGGQQIANVDPNTQAAMRQYQGLLPQLQGYQQQGAVLGAMNRSTAEQSGIGMRALAGDANATQSLMNPFQHQVVDQIKSQYGDLNSAAQTGIQDAATKAGAYGGSRHGVASGIASGEIAKGLGQQIAGVQQQGFNDAMGRAAGLAGLGQNAMQMAQGNLGYQSGLNAQQQGILDRQFGQGDYLRQIQQAGLDRRLGDFNQQRDWGVRNLDILKGAMTGMPYGQTTSQPLYSNPAAGFLGGAAQGAAIGSVIPGLGTGIGAAAGGILGLF